MVACGRSSVEVDAGVGQQAGRWTLAAVAAECQRTATAERPGVVEVATELRDSNATASIGVPCVIHLVDGADVTLNRVNLTTGVLNLHDRGTGPGENVVSIERSNITARAGAGILIELNDPDDKLRMEISQISAPAGIAIRVAGQRGEDNSGGSIQLTTSVLTSEGAGTSGIQVLASEHSGVIRLVRSALNTPGPLTVLSADCSSVVGANRLNCSADQVARELGS